MARGANANRAYQLEVKRALVQLCFNPANGWTVTVDADAMERARGGQHDADKGPRAAAAIERILALGAVVGKHNLFGRVDVVAEHTQLGTRLIEVEGDSSKQREQAMHSALGQVVLSMKIDSPGVRYGLAVPDSPEWIRQLRKIPPAVTGKLRLDLYAVGDGHVQMTEGGTAIPDWSR